MRSICKTVISVVLAIGTFFTSIFGAIRTGDPEFGRKRIDLSKFTMVWNDEFEGETLDRNKWGFEWWVTMRRGGYWHEDMVSVEKGNLIIRTEYKDKPLDFLYGERADWIKPYEAGYYTGQIVTRDKYEQRYGYFETRCILPAARGLWSAFWMMNEGVFNEDGSGKDGTEIDIFESFDYRDYKYGKDFVSSNLHFDGYKDAHQYKHVADSFLANDPYHEYNTYGVEWNPKEYIFYINGKEIARTSFGGVSENPEYLLLSVEVAGDDGVPSYDPKARTGDIRTTPAEDWPAEFIVDYVRCYQYNDLLAEQ